MMAEDQGHSGEPTDGPASRHGCVATGLIFACSFIATWLLVFVGYAFAAEAGLFAQSGGGDGMRGTMDVGVLWAPLAALVVSVLVTAWITRRRAGWLTPIITILLILIGVLLIRPLLV